MKNVMLNEILVKMVGNFYDIDVDFLYIDDDEEMVENCEYMLEFVNTNGELLIISICDNNEGVLFVVIEDDRLLIGDIIFEYDEVNVNVEVEESYIKKYIRSLK